MPTNWREQMHEILLYKIDPERVDFAGLQKDLESFIEQIVKEEKLKVLEEVLGRMPHSITPAKEPPKNKLSQNQIFGAGQMNMALRTTELLQALKSK